METLTAIREGQITTIVPVQILFGGCPVDPELGYVFECRPGWDDEIDEKLLVRCASL